MTNYLIWLTLSCFIVWTLLDIFRRRPRAIAGSLVRSLKRIEEYKHPRGIIFYEAQEMSPSSKEVISILWKYYD